MYRLLVLVLLCSIQINAFAEIKTAVFAGGCFWCMEKPYDEMDGVLSTTSGYTGGHTENPNYQQTSTGTTGHYEAMQVKYDADKISYKELLEIFWKNIDPFDASGQFCDKGSQYRAAIFTNNKKEIIEARESKKALQKKLKDKAKVVTEILPAKQFYSAEEYHQDYYKKNPIRYKYYRYGCGRDKRLEEVREIINAKYH